MGRPEGTPVTVAPDQQPQVERPGFFRRSRARLSLAALSPFLIVSAIACDNKPTKETPNDGYDTRSILHEVINPLNKDKYTSLEVRNRLNQERTQVDFHDLNSNPEKFERLVTEINGELLMVLNMQTEVVPVGDIVFQHSTILVQETVTRKPNVLQINRVKPNNSDAPKITAYSLFKGKENPEHLETIIISDKEKDGGDKGEVFVVLRAGTFDYSGTSERSANAYAEAADKLLKELKDKKFKDDRVLQAVWKDGDTMQGIIDGQAYKVVSEDGNDQDPKGYRKYGKDFKRVRISREDGTLVAEITADYYKGEGTDGPAVNYKFFVVSDSKKDIVLDFKRLFRNKSETQTSKGTGTTVGVTTGGQVVVGWTSVDLQTAVNFQNESTVFSSYGERDVNLTPEQQRTNSQKVSAILVLLGGASILDGLGFQDGEVEWRQSTQRVAQDAKQGALTQDEGFWLELPIDATTLGRQEAVNLLSGN